MIKGGDVVETINALGTRSGTPSKTVTINAVTITESAD